MRRIRSRPCPRIAAPWDEEEFRSSTGLLVRRRRFIKQMILARTPGTQVVIRGGGYIAQRIMTTATEDWLAKNRDLAEQFTVAYADAAQYARQHLDEAGEVMATRLAGLEPDVARKAVRHPPFDPRYSSLVARSWQHENDVLIAQDKIKESIPITVGFEPSITEKVQNEHLEYFSDLEPLPKE